MQVTLWWGHCQGEVSPEGSQESLIVGTMDLGKEKESTGLGLRPGVLGVDLEADNQKFADGSCSQWKYVSLTFLLHA